MSAQAIQQTGRVAVSRWLTVYYFLRASFAAAWVAAAFTVGASMPLIGAALLAAYPAWDAIANFVDAQRSGGLQANPSQALNTVVSVIATIAVIIAIRHRMHAVLAVFGGWAILSGLLQAGTGVLRWRTGAQWAMILSGVQSALAGGFFISKATGATLPRITDVAPYAAFGAFYFLVSALWLRVTLARHSLVDSRPRTLS